MIIMLQFFCAKNVNTCVFNNALSFSFLHKYENIQKRIPQNIFWHKKIITIIIYFVVYVIMFCLWHKYIVLFKDNYRLCMFMWLLDARSKMLLKTSRKRESLSKSLLRALNNHKTYTTINYHLKKQILVSQQKIITYTKNK